ncbi:MAG: glycosyltransferase [Ignavibacteriales bacterium]|nr:MAG: glycosyltransferase [Ignavibacteriales bacterium]
MNKFPKVLIIGECFNNRTGAGITMSNLFRGWDNEKLAVVTEYIDNADASLTDNYYVIGGEEKVRPWPFNYFRVTSQSGPLKLKQETKIKSAGNDEGKISAIVKLYLALNLLVGKVFSFFGFYHFIYRYSVSEKLLKFINEYKPDVIYSHLHYLEFMQFVQQVHFKTKIPLVIHMMDDWLREVEPNGLFKKYWQNKTENVFQEVASNASVRLSICDAMSEDYKRRYGFDFIPFHNPVETETWMKHSKNEWLYEKPFTILYAGRIGIGTLNAVIDIADAVEKLNEEGLQIVFEIQTRTNNKKLSEAIAGYKSVKLVPTLDYEKLPEKFSSVDLLVLPMDFDNKSLKYIWLSMPTKVSEYLSTGTPILVYAHPDTALARYAVDKKWADVVSEQNQTKLTQSIKNIYSDENFRRKLGEQSKSLAQNFHDAKVVREKFRQQLSFTLKDKIKEVPATIQ